MVAREGVWLVRRRFERKVVGRTRSKRRRGGFDSLTRRLVGQVGAQTAWAVTRPAASVSRRAVEESRVLLSWDSRGQVSTTRALWLWPVQHPLTHASTKRSLARLFFFKIPQPVIVVVVVVVVVLCVRAVETSTANGTSAQ